MKARAVVVSVGARTPIGLQALTTGFAHHAASIVMTQSAMLDVHDEPATMCLLPTLDPLLTGAKRALELGFPALEEALLPLAEVLPQMRVKLVLCLDDFAAVRAEGAPTTAAQQIANELTRRAAVHAPNLDDVFTVARGPASLGYAFGRIIEDAKNYDAVIVGSVHTDYDTTRIRGLSAAGRLFSPDRLDALIPGECAAFVVVMDPDKARHFRLETQANLNDCATGFEKARPDNDESAFEASGLTAATRKVVATMEADGLQSGWMLTDLSFERLRLYEFQSVMTRTRKHWCDPHFCDAPAQRIGYLGACAMPLHVVLAAEGWRRGWAPSSVAVSFAGSDSGERAVLLMSQPTR